MTRPRSPIPLLRGRVHEVEGPGASAFALIQFALIHLAAGARPPAEMALLWIRPGWNRVLPLPAGLAAVMPPERLILADSPSETDSLAIAEEALRDGIIPQVVIEITRPLDLREGRRLQLAARAGATTGICLVPQGMGSNAAETRWHVAPVFDADISDSTLMRWEITKNKSGTLGEWHVRWNGKAHHLDVVSPAPLGPGAAWLRA